MAAKNRKKKFVIKFTLTIWGLFGLGIVCFCIFLWMFLLGIWAGQTVLLPSSASGRSALSSLAIWSGKRNAAPAANIRTPPSHKQDTESNDLISPDGPSAFSVLIATVRNQERARQVAAGWRRDGQTAFFLPAGDRDGARWRVYVGRFEALADADRLAAQLAEEKKIQTNITLLPASRFPDH